ncbi:jg22966, partial [Pararge aegeria aegeria]
QYSDRPPSVIVASAGLQLVKNRNITDQALEEYKRNLTQLVQPVDSLASRGTQVLWKTMEAVDIARLRSDVKINNADIDAYNKAALE